jgi:hypothetical protein
MQTGTHVDGVISVTPSVVQKLLAITGSITLANGVELNGSNATKYLQHDIYWDYASASTKTSSSNDIVDGLFAEAADLTFHKALESLSADRLKQLAKLIFSNIDTREIMFWMTDASEQAQMAGLEASGGFSSSVEDPVLGVYTSILNPSKLSWYLDQTTTIGEGVKNADGTTTYSVTTTLDNTVTYTDVANGGTYIMGEAAGYELGDPRPIVNIVAPAGGVISDINYSGGVTEYYDQDYKSHEVVSIFVTLPAQSSFTVTYNVTVPASAESTLELSETPLLTEYRNAG